MELELHPLIEMLEEHRDILGQIRHMDLTNARLGPSGIRLVSHVIGLAECKIESLNLSRQRPGEEGIRALVGAIRKCPSINALRIKSCRFGDAGGQLLAELLEEGQEVHGLNDLDLQNNLLSHDMCCRIQQATKQQRVDVNLTGNRILDEVLNAISHGFGCVLAVVGTVFMGMAVSGKPAHFQTSAVFYSIALHTLYFASTLYHSFHALGPTVTRVFGILDHCAIYLLIAGSYCPFLWVLLPDDPNSGRLLLFLWTMALVGMITTAFYHGQGKMLIENTLYLTMGWSCASCMGNMMEKLGPEGSFLLVVGGVLYTVGVPFFIKNGRTLSVPDHTIWHLFVLAGSVAHYFCILWYVYGTSDQGTSVAPLADI